MCYTLAFCSSVYVLVYSICCIQTFVRCVIFIINLPLWLTKHTRKSCFDYCIKHIHALFQYCSQHVFYSAYTRWVNIILCCWYSISFTVPTDRFEVFPLCHQLQCSAMLAALYSNSHFVCKSPWGATLLYFILVDGSLYWVCCIQTFVWCIILIIDLSLSVSRCDDCCYSISTWQQFCWCALVSPSVCWQMSCLCQQLPWLLV